VPLVHIKHLPGVLYYQVTVAQRQSRISPRHNVWARVLRPAILQRSDAVLSQLRPAIQEQTIKAAARLQLPIEVTPRNLLPVQRQSRDVLTATRQKPVTRKVLAK